MRRENDRCYPIWAAPPQTRNSKTQIDCVFFLVRAFSLLLLLLFLRLPIEYAIAWLLFFPLLCCDSCVPIVCECAFALRCNWLFIWNTWISLFDRFDLFPFHLMLFKLVPDIVCVRRCVFFFIFSKPLFSIFILLVSFHSIISFVSFFPQQLYQARNKILLTNEKKNTKLEKKNREKTHTRTPNSSINSLYWYWFWMCVKRFSLFFSPL